MADWGEHEAVECGAVETSVGWSNRTTLSRHVHYLQSETGLTVRRVVVKWVHATCY